MTTERERELPTAARCVVIGGGVVGAAIAYHLGELGWRDVVVVDRAQPAGGSTFQAAGLVGQLHPTATMTRMAASSVELYRRLGGGEHDPGWHQSGSLRVAASAERWAETRRPGRLGGDARPARRAGLAA